MVITFNNLGGGGGSYVLPVATDSVLGGVKVGSGLTITNDGVLSSEGNDENVQHVYSAETIWNVPYQLKEGDVVYIPEHDEEFKVNNYLYQTMADNDWGLLETLDSRNISRNTIRRIVLKLQENENYDPETVEDINDKEVFIVNSGQQYYYGFWFNEGDYYYLSGETQVDQWTLIESYDVDGFEVVINIDVDEGDGLDEHYYPDPTHFYPYNNTYTPYYCDVDITHIVDLKTYQYSVNNFVDLNGLVYRVDDLRVELDTIGQDYTPTSGFTTINGSAITEGGNMVISADSTKIEEITTLPENPVDGAIYNYKGTLVRYVDGPGNWGQWVGLNSMSARTQSTLGSVTLFYGVFPESMDGQRIFTVSTFSQPPMLSGFLNLTNNTIDVYNNTSKTGSTVAVINLNATSETTLSLWLSTNATASWKNNVLQIRSGNESTIIEYWCPVSASTGHYELAEPRNYNYPLTRTSRTWSLQSYGVIFDEKTGMVNPGVPLNDSNRIIYVNASGSTNPLRFYGPASSPITRMYVPTSSGATGTLCVSNGGDSAPSFKTVTQALGVDFAVLTQDEYDALNPNAGGTGYTATRLYFIKDE